MGSSPVAVTYTSDIVLVLSKEFLDIQATLECGFTLERVRDMIRTYSQKITVSGIGEIKKHVLKQKVTLQYKKQCSTVGASMHETHNVSVCKHLTGEKKGGWIFLPIWKLNFLRPLIRIDYTSTPKYRQAA